jgi:DNA-directed RNA polymerase subunit RPC12/RpoP
MPLRTTCPHCGAELQARSDGAGRKARCPECRSSITLPTVQRRQPDDLFCTACQEWTDADVHRRTPGWAWGVAIPCLVLSLLSCGGFFWFSGAIIPFVLACIFGLLSFCFLFASESVYVCPYCRMRIGERL